MLNEEDPTILCLTEVALKSNEIHNYKLSNYKLLANYCRNEEKARGGGVSIYAKEESNLEYEKIEIATLCTDNIFEAAAVKLKIKQEDIIILATYRPPSENHHDIDNFIESLIDVLEIIQSNNNHLIIIGDLNICTMNPTYKLQRLNESLNIFDLKTTVNEPTRVTHNTQTCIDNIITNLNHGAFTTRVHKTQISDHYGISITLNQSHWLKKEIYKECRIGLGKNEPQLRYQELLENETWEKVYQEKDLNISYAVFEKILIKHFNFVFTKKYVGPKTNKTKK